MLRLLRLAIACVGVLLCAGCESEPAKPTPAASVQSISPLPSARRPLRRYYAINVNGRCSVFWIRPDKRSITREIRCPREIMPGERMRLVGKTCMREADDPLRNVPIRCPPALLRADRDDRLDAGDNQLPEQSPATPR